MAKRDINATSLLELKREVGARGISHLTRLAHWLLVGPPNDTSWELHVDLLERRDLLELNALFCLPPRFGPSFVCRAELELFGCSFPRFALRLQLHNDAGFINVRRLATLAGQIPDTLKLEGKDLRALVLEAPCVADAFLRPPPWAQRGWKIISAPLAKANGEVEPGEPDTLLTPYVQHMVPGGGMCAQAACIMTAALHANIEAPIHGMPQVTMIATNKPTDAEAEIIFDGLWTDEIEDYFNSPRSDPLGGCWQTAKIPYSEQDPNVLSQPDSNCVREFEHALVSYISSDIPTILPVDVGRMQNIGSGHSILYVQTLLTGETQTLLLNDPLDQAGVPSIFAENGLSQHLASRDTSGRRSHAIVLVGCTNREPAPDLWGAELAGHQRTKPDPIKFTFQDPAHKPFMKATAHQLLLGTCYERNTDTTSTSPATLLGWFFPVTPRSVKMPLLDQTIGAAAGIRHVSAALREKDISIGSLGLRSLELANSPPRFRLIPFRQAALKTQLESIRGENGGEPDLATLEILCSKLIPHDSDAWCWLEVGATSILMWDAETKVAKTEFAALEQEFESSRANASSNEAELSIEHAKKLAKRLLIAASIWREGHRIVRSYAQNTLRGASSPKRPRLKGHLRPTLLTSFDTGPRCDCFGIGTGAEPVESYVLMQASADRVLLSLRETCEILWRQFRHYVRQNPAAPLQPRVHLSALALMARASDNDELIRKTARFLLGGRREIVALATYLPSLCAGQRAIDGKKVNPALLATRFVLRVARALREAQGARRPLIVELVAGSLMLPPQPNEATGKYSAICIDPKVGRENLLICLKYLLPEIEAADVLLAFGYEPSPLCALGSLERVTDFCKRLVDLTRGDRRWARVGINLDIAHWAFLGRYQLGDLQPVVRERIFHAHVSSHSRGHLADAPLEHGSAPDLLRTPDEFMAWFMLLEDLMSTARFQGNVSLELECCKSRSAVHKSLSNLSDWLRSIY